MKRLIVLGLVLAILAVGFTAFADPIGVGGTFTSSAARMAVFPGEGIPQGKPFIVQYDSILLLPIGVGGT